jgi:hypothetical protein
VSAISSESRELVDAAVRVAGTVAARGRGDLDGARELLASFETHEELAQGALLVAELALNLWSREAGQSLDSCVSSVNLRLLGMR